MKRCIALFVVLFLVFSSCKRHSNMSAIPAITLVEMTPNSVQQGSSEDTVYIKFTLTDGDADLGHDVSSSDYDIYIRDNHTDSFTGYFFPEIAQNVLDPSKGISGTCTFKMLGALIYVRPDTVHLIKGDTVHYELYIKDRAGNTSNHISTPDLYIKP